MEVGHQIQREVAKEVSKQMQTKMAREVEGEQTQAPMWWGVIEKEEEEKRGKGEEEEMESVCWKILINNCQTEISLRYENYEKF